MKRHLLFLPLIIGSVSLLPLSMLHAQTNYTTPYTFSTFAGKTGLTGSTNGTGIKASFNAPFGVAADGSGNVYVADTRNHLIRMITASGVVSTIAGQAGIPGSSNGSGTNASFYFPTGVAVGGSGNVYVADFANKTIRMIDTNGVVSTIAGVAGVAGSTDGAGTNAHFYYPKGVAVDSSGNVYVADNVNCTIRMIDTNDVVSTIAGVAGTPGSADGTGTNALFNNPGGIAVDGSGNIYVADSDNQTIRKIDTNDVVSTIAGVAGIPGSADKSTNTSNALFNNPGGIAVDGGGNVYVADSGNNTIRTIATNGNVSTLAGKPLFTGSANGTGAAVRFSYPTGVAVDGNSNAYVSDTFNNTIRKGMPPIQFLSFVSSSRVLIVKKALQTIEFEPFSPVSVGAPAITLPATSSAGQAVTYTSSNKRVATASGNTLTVLDSGLTTITATVPASANNKSVTVHQVLKVTT